KALKTKIDAFKTDVELYRQAAEDVSEIDCASDVLGVRAAIESAKTNQQKVITEVGEIRADATNVIKPTLVQIKTDLQTQIDAAAQPAVESEASTEGATTDATQ